MNIEGAGYHLLSICNHWPDLCFRQNKLGSKVRQVIPFELLNNGDLLIDLKKQLPDVLYLFFVFLLNLYRVLALVHVYEFWHVQLDLYDSRSARARFRSAMSELLVSITSANCKCTLVS